MDKIKIRPKVKTLPTSTNSNETFQNEVLRPIIKLQHELILTCFEHHINQKKITIESTANKILIQNKLRAIIKKDNQLKADLKNLIIGLFTIEEYKEYLLSKSEINKRTLQIIEERIVSTLIK